MFQNIDWSSVIGNIISSLAVTLVTAIIGFIFINRYLSKLNFSNKMQSYGFVNTSTNKQSRKEIKSMCKNATLVKIINVSGFHYLNANEILLKDALKDGVEIRFLCSNPESIFLKDIENMEYNVIDDNGKRMRDRNKKIKTEIWDLITKYKDIGMQVRFYSTEYRLPYVIAYYKDNSVRAWLTMTLPPYKSTKSFVLRGKRDSSMSHDEDINFIDMMETNFDTIWNYSSVDISSMKRSLKENG